MRTYELNRKMYDKVRKMDHGQMKSFCEALYTRGFEAGKREAERLSGEEVKQALLQVKGIGEKKACDIAAALTRTKEGRGIDKWIETKYIWKCPNLQGRMFRCQ